MDQEETAITTIMVVERPGEAITTIMAGGERVIPVGEESKRLEVENSIVLEVTIQIVTMVYVR